LLAEKPNLKFFCSFLDLNATFIVWGNASQLRCEAAGSGCRDAPATSIGLVKVATASLSSLREKMS
jgi:hypothetical protein